MPLVIGECAVNLGFMQHDDEDARGEWAESRTNWAEDRTMLANERTFSGWMRTGLAAVAVGIGLKAVFGAVEPTWVAKSVATVFLVAAIVIFWSARRHARATHDRLNTHDANAQSIRNFTVLAVVLTIGALATGAVLWSL